MDKKKTDSSYEQLYSELVEYAVSIHDRNKRRIKYGSIVLVILPFVLFFIRWITDSDKVVFLLIGVIALVILAFYLIGVEYLDNSIKKKLREMTNREADFDSILAQDQIYEKYMDDVRAGRVPSGPVSERVRRRIEELREHDIDACPHMTGGESEKEGDDQ